MIDIYPENFPEKLSSEKKLIEIKKKILDNTKTETENKQILEIFNIFQDFDKIDLFISLQSSLEEILFNRNLLNLPSLLNKKNEKFYFTGSKIFILSLNEFLKILSLEFIKFLKYLISHKDKINEREKIIKKIIENCVNFNNGNIKIEEKKGNNEYSSNKSSKKLNFFDRFSQYMTGHSDKSSTKSGGAESDNVIFYLFFKKLKNY